MPLSDLGIKRGQPGARYLVQAGLAFRGACRDLQIDIAPAELYECLMKRGHRLDINSTPAPIIERTGDRVAVRIVGANVNIRSVLDVTERSMKHYVFKILRVADECMQVWIDKSAT